MVFRPNLNFKVRNQFTNWNLLPQINFNSQVCRHLRSKRKQHSKVTFGFPLYLNFHFSVYYFLIMIIRKIRRQLLTLVDPKTSLKKFLVLDCLNDLNSYEIKDSENEPIVHFMVNLRSSLWVVEFVRLSIILCTFTCVGVSLNLSWCLRDFNSLGVRERDSRQPEI